MIFLEIARVTVRGLLGRRRTILLVLLAAVPVLVGLLVHANQGSLVAVGATVDALVVRIILPLVALVFGTAALGSELEDGLAVHLLTKPIGRSTIVLAKTAVAGSLTAALVVPSTAITALLIAPASAAGADTVALAVGALVGSYVYAAIFVALGVVTSRGLIVGLGYALIWEGLLAGLLPGSQVFSVREYVRGIASVISPGVLASVVGSAGFLYAAIALVAAVAVAAYRLARFEVRGGD
ncbi:MAG TPA: ABC transporter permease [Candidatus Limnocylindrales bacterium]|nr:ABC transporter permease [Candidatus Limnocylindrales bacterium]